MNRQSAEASLAAMRRFAGERQEKSQHARTIALHYQRLKRHYDAVLHSYDEVSLLDLSHSLRMWADLKVALPSIAPAFATALAFKGAAASKTVYRVARQRESVVCYFPDEVITFASQGFLSGGPGMEGNGDFFHSLKMKYQLDGSVQLRDFCFIQGTPEDFLLKAAEAVSIKRHKFSEWLGSEAVRVNYPTKTRQLEVSGISREMIIRRVANVLDGSHPSAATTPEFSNKFDPPVIYLMKWQMGGLPLPYFILLKLAADILACGEKHFATPHAPTLVGEAPPGLAGRTT